MFGHENFQSRTHRASLFLFGHELVSVTTHHNKFYCYFLFLVLCSNPCVRITFFRIRITFLERGIHEGGATSLSVAPWAIEVVQPDHISVYVPGLKKPEKHVDYKPVPDGSSYRAPSAPLNTIGARSALVGRPSITKQQRKKQ